MTKRIQFCEWREGLRTIQLTKLIRETSDADDLAKAKRIVDSLLDGSRPTINLRDDVEFDAFAVECARLGATVKAE